MILSRPQIEIAMLTHKRSFTGHHLVLSVCVDAEAKGSLETLCDIELESLYCKNVTSNVPAHTTNLHLTYIISGCNSCSHSFRL